MIGFVELFFLFSELYQMGLKYVFIFDKRVEYGQFLVKESLAIRILTSWFVFSLSDDL